MSPGFKDAIRSQKAGAENAIVVQLPTDRFLDKVQPHRSPPVDEQGLSSVRRAPPRSCMCGCRWAPQLRIRRSRMLT